MNKHRVKYISREKVEEEEEVHEKLTQFIFMLEEFPLIKRNFKWRKQEMKIFMPKKINFAIFIDSNDQTKINYDVGCMNFKCFN